jgi:hypothetical protein
MIAILCLDEWEYRKLEIEGRFAGINGTAIWSREHLPSRDRITDIITSPHFYQHKDAIVIRAAVEASMRANERDNRAACWTLAWSGEDYRIDHHLGDDSYTLIILDRDGPREIVLPRGHEEEEARRLLRLRGIMRAERAPLPPVRPRVVLRIVPGSLWAKGDGR